MNVSVWKKIQETVVEQFFKNATSATLCISQRIILGRKNMDIDGSEFKNDSEVSKSENENVLRIWTMYIWFMATYTYTSNAYMCYMIKYIYTFYSSLKIGIKLKKIKSLGLCQS